MIPNGKIVHSELDLTGPGTESCVESQTSQTSAVVQTGAQIELTQWRLLAQSLNGQMNPECSFVLENCSHDMNPSGLCMLARLVLDCVEGDLKSEWIMK